VGTLHPIVLEASLHETLWGGRRLEREGWKKLPPTDIVIGESWETEISTVALNEPYAGRTLGSLIEELGPRLLGQQAMAISGQRFPLLAKFIDANDKLSVQVHPDDIYANQHEHGKLGKTEFWYILDAVPGASIIHGFKAHTSRREAEKAIEDITLEKLLQDVNVSAGDVIFVPAGTVHAIGSGIMLYELQEYSDITYRMYDYGRLTAIGTPRELHVERALEVSVYDRSPHIKMQPLPLPGGEGYRDRCLVACQYFVTRELVFEQNGVSHSYMKSKTEGSCIILSSLGAEVMVRYGDAFEYGEKLARGRTMVLPAALGDYCIQGSGNLLLSYVPAPNDEVRRLWEEKNGI
jgi:mannose-6-phosphate isomerase